VQRIDLATQADHARLAARLAGRGAIGLYQFQPGETFVRYGNSGIVPKGRPEPIVDRQDVGVAQGFVEGSNVNPIREMMRLIQVQRAFDQITALMRDGSNALDQSVKTLGTS